MEREERKSKIEELEARKPDQKISEKDLEEIENAAKTMGDYKLKSSDDYEVPKHERVNASQKKHQMLLLESSLYSMKSEFNKKVVEMRQKKKSLIEKITNQNERLGEINKTLKLDPKMDIFQPTIDGDLEEPEKSLEITDKDVKNFAREKRRKEQELLKKKHKKIEEVQEQEESDSDQEGKNPKKP
jgi:cilia- and flagella-associated protein 44